MIIVDKCNDTSSFMRPFDEAKSLMLYIDAIDLYHLIQQTNIGLDLGSRSQGQHKKSVFGSSCAVLS